VIIIMPMHSKTTATSNSTTTTTTTTTAHTTAESSPFQPHRFPEEEGPPSLPGLFYHVGRHRESRLPCCCVLPILSVATRHPASSAGGRALALQATIVEAALLIAESTIVLLDDVDIDTTTTTTTTASSPMIMSAFRSINRKRKQYPNGKE
jgi:hypothetical protein